MQDPGEERPASCPLRVGYCHERDEYVEFWFQENKAKDASLECANEANKGRVRIWIHDAPQSRRVHGC